MASENYQVQERHPCAHHYGPSGVLLWLQRCDCETADLLGSRDGRTHWPARVQEQLMALGARVDLGAAVAFESAVGRAWGCGV